MTPNDPRLTYDPLAQVESLKLVHMCESCGHAIQHGWVKTLFSENDL